MTNERFLTLADVADVLNISASQTTALVRSGDLQGIQIGGRKQWRVERSKLEEYIDRAYRQAGATPGEATEDETIQDEAADDQAALDQAAH